MNFVAASSVTFAVILWDIDAYAILGEFRGHQSAITCAAFSKDNQFLISGSYDKAIRIWNVATQEKLKHYNCDSSAVSVCFNRERSLAIAHMFDESVKVLLLMYWDSHASANHPAKYGSCKTCISYDDTKYVCCNTKSGRSFKPWDHVESDICVDTVDTGKVFFNQTPLHQLKGHSLGCVDVSVSPVDNTAASCSSNGEVLLWDLDGGHILATFLNPLTTGQSHEAKICFNNAGTQIASSHIKLLSIWELASHQLLLSFETNGIISCFGFTPDDTRIAVGQRVARGPVGDCNFVLYDISVSEASLVPVFESPPEEVKERGADIVICCSFPAVVLL